MSGRLLRLHLLQRHFATTANSATVFEKIKEGAQKLSYSNIIEVSRKAYQLGLTKKMETISSARFHLEEAQKVGGGKLKSAHKWLEAKLSNK